MRYRTPKPGDNVGAPCDCLECQAAGLVDVPIIRVPADDFVSVAHWLHGEPLKRWYEAREQALQKLTAQPIGDLGDIL
jgi:hypothetical protein